MRTSTSKPICLATIACFKGRAPYSTESLFVDLPDNQGQVALTDITVASDKKSITGKVGAFPEDYTPGGRESIYLERLLRGQSITPPPTIASPS